MIAMALQSYAALVALITLTNAFNITALHTTATSLSFTIHDAPADLALPKPPARSTITACRGS